MMSRWMNLPPVQKWDIEIDAGGDQYGLEIDIICRTLRARITVFRLFAKFALSVLLGNDGTQLRIDRRKLTCGPH